MQNSVVNLPEKLDAFARILQIMDELRAGCPWDKEQTMDSLRVLTIEETYELAEAITASDINNVKEELGDVFLHLIFYSKIAEEDGEFDISGVLNDLAEKMIRRHPHIYATTEVNGTDDVMRNWEAIKLQEKGKDNKRKSVLDGVPRSLPALPKALRIQQKAKKVGFEWDTKAQVWEKVKEEMAELQEAIANDDQANIEKEFGDVLFSLANYARFLKVDPEGALERTNHKFIRRFQRLEEIAIQREQDLTKLDLAAMDAIWDEVKLEERNRNIN